MNGLEMIIIVCGGRNISIHDNLFISCKYAVTGMCGAYHDALFGDPTTPAIVNLPRYMYNDIWVKAYPEMSQLITDTTGLTEEDYQIWNAPVNVIIMDNYSFGDRSNSTYKGIVTLNVNSERNGHFERLNPGTIVDMTEENGNLTSFNSRREGMPEIKEALETASAFVDITYEQFLEMGTDWTPAE